MTLALARELAPHIPVAMIQPAMIDPPPDFTEAEKQAVIAQTPLRRFGSPERRQPADPLSARRHQLRHRRLLPGRRRAILWVRADATLRSVHAQEPCDDSTQAGRDHRQHDLRRMRRVVVDRVVGRDHAAVVAQRVAGVRVHVEPRVIAARDVDPDAMALLEDVGGRDRA